MTELLQHQAADGLVFTLGGAEPGRLGHLVDAQQTGNVPTLTGLHDIGGRLVVFVADVADDLLDDVLDGHHARGPAVFVDHQRGLQGVGAQLRHHVVAVQGGGHPGDGLLRIDEVADATGFRASEGEYETIGGLVLQELGHIPEEGESVELTAFDPDTPLDDPVHWLATVVRMDGRRIDQLELTELGRRDDEVDGDG